MRERVAMWEQFTDRTSRALFFAYAEAARLGAERVGAQHLLLGLARDRDSVATRVLGRLGLPGARVRQEMVKRLAAPQDAPGGEIALDPGVNEVFNLALEEARALGYDAIGPEHLLLGILRHGQSEAARLFADWGIDLENARREVVYFASGGHDNPLEIPGWQRFRARARRVISLAQDEALAFGQEKVAPEHLLLGLIREEDCFAARLLTRLGADLDRIREDVEARLGQRGHGSAKNVELEESARRVLSAAVEEAWSDFESDVGTEHLLLGLIREGEGIVADTLGAAGVSLERARQETVAALSGFASLRTVVRQRVAESLGRQRGPKKAQASEEQPGTT
ncbi:MAG TPA: Clp protease N-terminal domain-containing protein [Armatimonadota bacterium]|nr:Clp protease N-terminal domain-containing protein [Armatimonadota bacterium]